METNEELNDDELERFYKPPVFHPVEDIENTHNGLLPGHRQRWFDAIQSEYPDTWTIIDKPEKYQRDWSLL